MSIETTIGVRGTEIPKQDNSRIVNAIESIVKGGNMQQAAAIAAKHGLMTVDPKGKITILEGKLRLALVDAIAYFVEEQKNEKNFASEVATVFGLTKGDVTKVLEGEGVREGRITKIIDALRLTSQK
jgi:predicted transcriptional regulator